MNQRMGVAPKFWCLEEAEVAPLAADLYLRQFYTKAAGLQEIEDQLRGGEVMLMGVQLRVLQPLKPSVKK